MTLQDYQCLSEQAAALIEGEPDLIANLANVSALLNLELEHINWVGFYLLKGEQLVLGPFQGKPACVRIPLGLGVCGSAFQNNQVLRVDNVHNFVGHIACDAVSVSEIVIPFTIDGHLIGVLDIDSPIEARFSSEDEKGLVKLMSKVEKLLK
jgi:L-methionine (R)-S-oxide reductase